MLSEFEKALFAVAHGLFVIKLAFDFLREELQLGEADLHEGT